MSIERELLKVAVIALEDAHFNAERDQAVHLRAAVIKQLKDALLAQPEQPEQGEQKPLTEEEAGMLIFSVAGDQYSPPNRFELVRATEKAHGIGVDDER